MNGKIRWCSLNRENLKMFDVMSLILKNPFKLQFTKNVSVNYQFRSEGNLFLDNICVLSLLSRLSSSSILYYVFSFVWIDYKVHKKKNSHARDYCNLT
jgi:hypothetical protein